MIHASAFSEIFVPAEDIGLAVVLLVGFATALRRAGVASPHRSWAVALAAAVVLAWYGLVSTLAMRGVFQAAPDARAPALPLAVFLPILVGAVALPRISLVTRALDATPLSWLIGVQALRVIGLAFVVEWALGSLPGVFAVPAGFGDIAVGLAAIFIARVAAADPARARLPALLWSAFGLADLATALTTGFLSSPGRLQLLSPDAPNLIGSAYPLALIPTFGVPIYVLLHFLTLWKWLRTAERPGASSLLTAAD